ncbi:putative uncharacterized protein [Parachlamydia acanthamoebae UV-7]|jgi:hypothetical protein|uniref:Uncharacterized protein n=2 Tax=Parachlamydia acanthamoebae TaxID=83552 RepID=F8L0F5_PARAV|nr:hypothetical protein [Parachlamydia acanthamoebae]EFB41661.1 hypothetical protein pah_c026o102 [Parachlamydia acanthamoebae str. Hall's coccus]CCB86690.1 putative uncharacterized protein [Parachlamydia acanthamoebae UV-7]
MHAGFFALLVLVGIHVFANTAKVLGWVWRGAFLSFAAGVSFAYVFVDLLPALEKGQPALKRAFGEMIPYLDLHAYVTALIGVLFYYGLHTQKVTKTNFWLTISGYLLFNFFVGASLSDSTNPEIQPIILFTIAMGMHYFIHDHNTNLDNSELYQDQVRWTLVIALVLGYVVGYLTHIPDAVVAIVISFVSGGVILNSLRYELPKRDQVGYPQFVLGALLYTAILIRVGES